MINAPIDITSVSHWNTSLRKAKSFSQTVIVDFHAKWCQPCHIIAPAFTALAAQYPHTVFLRVDVDEQKGIAQKYRISAMPTFIVIRDGPVDSVRGADRQGLNAMVAKYATTTPPLPAEAEKAKIEGNEAFSKGEYGKAIEAYTRAIDVAPNSAVLYANRSYAYLKMVRARMGTVEERNGWRPEALNDATKANDLEQSWGKGWIRLAEALLTSLEEETAEAETWEDTTQSSDYKAQEGQLKTLTGAKVALEKGIELSEGKVKADAQKILNQVNSLLTRYK